MWSFVLIPFLPNNILINSYFLGTLISRRTALAAKVLPFAGQWIEFVNAMVAWSCVKKERSAVLD